MCGIVGYVGTPGAQDYLLSGLARLEYRGYDSSGIVTIENERPTLHRAVGKVAELGKLVSDNSATIGIGHTRWATHGTPSERNAHPHQAGDIFLVHNGIIENYKELKAELSDHVFTSDTDTEVLAALINKLYGPDTTLAEAVAGAAKLVKGTYGIAVISTREPEIVVARLGSPILIGIGDGVTYVASDASALLGYTSKVIYLKDGEIAVCTASGVDVTDISREPVLVTVEEIATEMAAIQKQGFDYFLLKEIHDQPVSLASTLSGRIADGGASVRLGGLNLSDDQLRRVRHIIIVGCGTAYYAGLLASYFGEDLLDDVTFEVVVASEYRYRSFNVPDESIALIVSQSGETADTLACLRELKRRGVPTLGIINAVGSTIARDVDGGVYVHAGPEISVASTKAFTCQVSAMLLFSLVLAGLKGTDKSKVAKYADELNRLPDAIASMIDNESETIQTIAAHFKEYDHALFVGRDTAYPVALEGALKLKEISYVHAEGYALGELKHGPIALIDDRFFEVVVLPKSWLLEKSLSGVAEIAARNGHILAVTNTDGEIDAEEVIRVRTDLEVLAPLVLNVALQLFAYHVAVLKGNDVDQPRNLAKSVTVE